MVDNETATEKTHSGGGRTWLCTVLFLDIIGYSKHSVEKQLSLKTHFNEIVSDAIHEVPEKDRIILDTGDGAAICFLGDPEVAIFSAIELRNDIATSASKGGPDYEVRIGVNLGPVKLIKDVNGRQNAVGDGINSAQRIMNFAQANQILVSRSYYEVVSCIGDEMAHLFSYMGVRADKHVREHVVYELQGQDGGAVADQPQNVVPIQSTAAATAVAAEPVADTTVPVDPQLLGKLEDRLVERIGPMARVLVRRCAAQSTNENDLQQQLIKAVPEQEDLPQLLSELCGAYRHSDAEHSSPASTNDTVQKPEKVAPSAESFPDNFLQHLTTLLAEEVGPLAGLLVKKAAAKAATQVELVDLLTAELPDSNARQRFIEKL